MAPAQAQQSAAITMALNPSDEPLRDDNVLVLTGVVTYTADWTGALTFTGTPVTYTITAAPEWASVVVSPASDMFPAPSSPQPGLAYTVSRQITITISLAEELARDATGVIELSAVTTAGIAGKSVSGKGAVPIRYDAPEKPCDEAHAQELLALAKRAADAYAAEQGAGIGASAPAASPRDDDVVVQSGSATPLPLPWGAVAAFGLAGAGVGLLMRRRLLR